MGVFCVVSACAAAAAGSAVACAFAAVAFGSFSVGWMSALLSVQAAKEKHSSDVRAIAINFFTQMHLFFVSGDIIT